MKSLQKRFLVPLFVVLIGSFLSACGGGGGLTLTVNSNNDVDDGTCNAVHCSLREAIHKANTMAGTITIKFNIAPGGAKTIQPSFALPEITGTVVIDGASQPGFSSAPLIELDGSHISISPVDGLVIKGGNSVVKSLVVNRFSGRGILVGFPGGVKIQGCYIGTDLTGSLPAGNHAGGIVVAGNENEIGGTAPGDRNVISANLGDGVAVNGTLNDVWGNIIGLNAAGTAPLGNQGNGVTFDGDINLLGGTTDGARNIISGNLENGVLIRSDNIDVKGNYIGTDVTGSVALGNQANGIKVFGLGGVQIGSGNSGGGNVISANGLTGVWLDESSFGAYVLGNLIGTDRTGTAALGNIKAGIQVGGANHRIGGPFDSLRNLISGNGGPGIAVLSTSTGGMIQNNFIGTTLDGKSALGNNMGIEVGMGAGATNVLIGGAPNTEGNVISGNTEEGVLLYHGATVQGNYIGTDDTGLAPLGNGGNGILALGAGNLIGGTGMSNTIAFNGKNGVAVISNSGGATGNSILSNSIHDNDGLGIALGGNIVVPNDYLDTDLGDNRLQNYPTLDSAVSDPVAINTTITGFLNSTPSTAFVIEFFTNTACDPSGHGEGHRLIKTLNVTTDVGGHAGLNVVFPGTIFDVGNFITATATDPSGNTSGFSNCIPVTEAAGVTPTPNATATPTPVKMTFKPFFDPAEIFYGPRCTPDKVRLSVEIGNPPEPISYVLLFVRLMDKQTGEKTDWGGGLSMIGAGKNAFYYDLMAYDVPNYTAFESAWLQYQFVVYNKAEVKIGYSEVFGDVAFTRCGPNKPAGAK